MDPSEMIIGEHAMLRPYLEAAIRESGGLSEGTLFLLDAEGEIPGWVRNVVFLSSQEVYSPEAGEGVDESRPTFARSDYGRRLVRAERELAELASERGLSLTVVRPAWMFGNGIGGYMLSLYNRVIRGHYVHIRGNESRLSLVTARDVARAMVGLAGKEGVYNLADSRPVTWLELCSAMTAHNGAEKRMSHLPEKWARFIYRWFGALPIVEETLSPAALEPVSRTLTLDNRKAVEATGLDFFDTLEVIARRSAEYPYGV